MATIRVTPVVDDNEARCILLARTLGDGVDYVAAATRASPTARAEAVSTKFHKESRAARCPRCRSPSARGADAARPPQPASSGGPRGNLAYAARARFAAWPASDAAHHPPGAWRRGGRAEPQGGRRGGGGGASVTSASAVATARWPRRWRTRRIRRRRAATGSPAPSRRRRGRRAASARRPPPADPSRAAGRRGCPPRPREPTPRERDGAPPRRAPPRRRMRRRHRDPGPGGSPERARRRSVQPRRGTGRDEEGPRNPARDNG